MGSLRRARHRRHPQIHGDRIRVGVMELGGDRNLLPVAFLRRLVRRNAEGDVVVIVDDRNQQGRHRHGGRCAVGTHDPENLRTFHRSVREKVNLNCSSPRGAHPLSPIQSYGGRAGAVVISSGTESRSRQGRKRTPALHQTEGKRAGGHSARQLNFDSRRPITDAALRLR